MMTAGLARMGFRLAKMGSGWAVMGFGSVMIGIGLMPMKEFVHRYLALRI